MPYRCQSEKADVSHVPNSLPGDCKGVIWAPMKGLLGCICIYDCVYIDIHIHLYVYIHIYIWSFDHGSHGDCARATISFGKPPQG